MFPTAIHFPWWCRRCRRWHASAAEVNACRAWEGHEGRRTNPSALPDRMDLAALVRSNGDFRRVLETGVKSQIVAMNLPRGVSIGEERHANVEQTFMFFSGSGVMTIEGERMTVRPGTVVVVPPGTLHDVTATGLTSLKLATIYAPPNHLPGRVQRTRAEAEADREDEEYGRKIEEG